MGRRRILTATIAVVVLVATLALLVPWRDEGGTEASPRAAQVNSLPEAEPSTLLPPGEASPLAADLESPRAAGGRSEVPAQTPWVAPLRGRVVYLGHEDVGVPGLQVAFGDPDSDPHVATDREGRFQHPRRLPRGGLSLHAADPLSGSWHHRSHEHRPGPDGAAATELVWAIETGPTFLVRLVNAPDDVRAWRLRLLERLGDGRELPWSWIQAHAGEQSQELWARYSSSSQEPRPRSSLVVQVADAEGLHGGETPIRSLGTVHELTIPVGVVGATLTGRVSDEDGRPVHARLHALRDQVLGQEAFSWPEAETDADGGYVLGGLEPGPTRLVVATPDRELTSVPIELLAGQRHVQDVQLATVRIAGDIRGALVAPSAGPDPAGLLRLSCLDGKTVERIQICGDDEERDGPGAGLFAEFAFDDLPQGRYRLELIPFDGRSYEATTLELFPPATDVRFVTREVPVGDVEEELVLRVLEGESRQELDRFVYLFLLRDLWILENERGSGGRKEVDLPRGLSLSLLVTAPGCVPRMASTDDARRVGEQLELSVELARSEALAVLVLDGTDLLRSEGIDAGFLRVPAARGLPGARVRARGTLLATSDAHGLATCSSRPDLADLEVTLPGWSLAAIEAVDPLAAGTGYVQAFLVRD
jgi:hypothetical protein